MIEFFLDAATLLGIPKSVAAIYGICFASPEPLSFSDINARLNLSSGSISQGLRVLKEVGALKIIGAQSTSQKETKVTKDKNGARGSKVSCVTTIDYPLSNLPNPRSAGRYSPDLELRKLVLHWIEKRLQKQIASGKNRLDLIANAIPNGPKTSVELMALPSQP